MIGKTEKTTSTAHALSATLRGPSASEVEAIRQARDNLAKRPARPAVTLKADGPSDVTISNPHTDTAGWIAHTQDVFGSSSEAFFQQSYSRIATAVADGQRTTQDQANAALALMGGIAPTNELEAVIGEQIIAAHAASLCFLRRARLNAGEYRDTAVAYVNAATKLTRTMGALVETLAKLRCGGRQRIEVVYVNGPAVIGDNAQAIIAGGGGECGGGNVDQPHALATLASLPAAPSLPMRREDPERRALPIASRAQPEALPDARRQEPWRADRQ